MVLSIVFATVQLLPFEFVADAVWIWVDPGLYIIADCP